MTSVEATDESKVTPWEVVGDVDYDKLIRDFGSSPIKPELIDRVERVTGKKAHHFLRRGIFFSHRDLEKVLDSYEKGEPFYLYTGRGPSSESMHMGHLIPFTFTKWLQDTFDIPLVIQMTEDEKFYFKDLTLEEAEKLAQANIKDILALGFNPEKTFIFTNCNYMGTLYRTVARIEKALTSSQVRGCFGFQSSSNMGMWMFPGIQCAPAFSVAFPHIFPVKKNVLCLVPQAIDQDPYFRITRDIAPRLGYLKPAVIHSKFFPALSGASGKMSSSTGAAVFLTDTPKEIKDKINKHAFSGGGATKEQAMELGANTDVDVTIQWLSFFLEDDALLAKVTKDYALGRILSSDVKKLLISTLSDIVTTHQQARKKITQKDLEAIQAIRPMFAKPKTSS